MLDSYYIVVDTNVLISDLHLIKEIKDTPVEGCGPPHIFIPWIVMKELDFLKKKAGKARAATEAIRYLNSVLRAKHPRFHGQSPQEAEEWAKKYSKCNDDRILECCLNLAEKMPREKVVLLTSDKNLANKALICDIAAYDWDSILQKLKPDVIFKGVRESKMKNRKRKNCKMESNASTNNHSTNLPHKEDKSLRKKFEECKNEIHTCMAYSKQMLKDALQPLLEEEMPEAYGEPWETFQIERRSLKDILRAIKKYWNTVFSFRFSEKDKRNFDLLHEKSSRPEGFFGNKEECMNILTAIEDVFQQIRRKWPHINASVEKIQDLRVSCLEAFRICSDIGNTIKTDQMQSALDAFQFDWSVMNKLCGMVMDFCEIDHNFQYEKPPVMPPRSDFVNLMCNLYPSVQNLKKLMGSMVESIHKSTACNSIFKQLHKALIDFVPSLEIQKDTTSFPHFTYEVLQTFCTCPQNRDMIEIGYKQLEKFANKLEKALVVMMIGKRLQSQ